MYYLYGPSTVDDIIFGMINMKSEVVTDALDGQARNYQLSRTSKTECIEQVKELKEAGKLNPIIVNRKKEKKKSPQINDFFGKTKAEFVKRESSAVSN